MDTKAGSSYAYVALISKLNRNPDQRKYKRIEIMMTWTSQKIEMYKVQVFNIRGVFGLAHYPEQSGKGNFANYPKPGVDIITKYQHLKSVEIHDTNIKPELPIHLILWASEYAKIKTNLTPRVRSQENQ